MKIISERRYLSVSKASEELDCDVEDIVHVALIEKQIKGFSMKKIISIALMLLPVLTYADDEYMTGNKLLRLIESSNSNDRLFAQGYITGAIETITFSKVLLRAQISACVPDGVTYTQINDVVHNYLKKEAKERHKPATLIIASSFSEAYPCTLK